MKKVSTTRFVTLVMIVVTVVTVAGGRGVDRQG